MKINPKQLTEQQFLDKLTNLLEQSPFDAETTLFYLRKISTEVFKLTKDNLHAIDLQHSWREVISKKLENR